MQLLSVRLNGGKYSDFWKPQYPANKKFTLREQSTGPRNFMTSLISLRLH
jgi:hypothetical protein